MPTHIFSLNEENWEIVRRTGVVGIPGFPDDKKDLNDQLLSRLLIVKPSDDILFYISKRKEIFGIYKALEYGFYDTKVIWSTEREQIYPFRIRFDVTEFSFEIPIKLDEIYDLKDTGLIWTFSLQRPNNNSPNSLFSITNSEKMELFKRLMKKNATARRIRKIPEPYPNRDPNLRQFLSIANNKPKYEATVMALLNECFTQNKFQNYFGEYSDYIAYIPTSFQKEMDLLVLIENPNNLGEILSYNIIELKKDRFDEKALTQLIQYEDWFLRKRASGDYSMIRATAIASRFDQVVKDYVKKRSSIENKEIVLLRYEYIDGEIHLEKE